MAGRRSAVDGKQRRSLARSCVVGALIVGSTARATDKSRDDAWWTGPMTAASAAMLPQGHILIDPYSLRNQSVYGTAPAFQGEARPGDSFTADAAAEYSLTQNWVLALDVIYQHGASTRVIGSQPSAEGGTAAVSAVTSASGSSYLVGFAPAVEYNWNGSVGILLGVRVFEIGRNVTATVTPVIAINLAL